MRLAAALFVLFPVALALSACAQLSATRPTKGGAAATDPAVGDQLVLKRELKVMPGDIDAWFDARFYQAAVPSLQSVLLSDPLSNALRCGLRLRRPVPRGAPAVTLRPTSLTVGKLSRSSEPLGIDPATVSMQGDNSTDVILRYRIALKSVDQPQIAAVFCQQRYPLLSRGTAFPGVIDLLQQAGPALQWLPADGQ